jgi:hypothetical protein
MLSTLRKVQKFPTLLPLAPKGGRSNNDCILKKPKTLFTVFLTLVAIYVECYPKSPKISNSFTPAP